MGKIIEGITQGTPAWHALRKNRIGASCAPILMGYHKYSTPYKLWMQMIEMAPAQVETGAMSRGKRLEIDAIALYEKEYGVTLFGYTMESEDNWTLIASMDGITQDLSKAVEVKCLNLAEHSEQEVPEIYYPQLQHQMYVCDLQTIDYVGYHPNADIPFYVIPVTRDEKFLAKYIPIVQDFFDCVNTLREPKKVDKDYADYSKNTEYRNTEEKYLQLCEKLDELEKEKESCKVKLLDICEGKNTIGSLTKLTAYVNPGRIDYKKIPVLANMNLECYRSPPTSAVRLTKI